MSQISNLILALNPVGYWKLDEESGLTVIDSSGSGIDGSYVGSVALGQSPFHSNAENSEKAISLGGNGNISIPYNPLIAAQNPFTFFGLFKRLSNNVNQAFFHKGNFSSSGNQGAAFVAVAGGNILKIEGFSGGWYGADIAELPDPSNDAFTLSICYPGGTSIKTCINGVEYETSIPVAISGSASALVIGANYSSGYYNKLIGGADEIAWFNRALASADLIDLHNAAFPPYVVHGVILDSSNQAVSRTVRAYRRDNGFYIGSALSSSATGEYSLNTYHAGEVQIVMLDDDPGNLENDQILRTSPV